MEYYQPGQPGASFSKHLKRTLKENERVAQRLRKEQSAIRLASPDTFKASSDSSLLQADLKLILDAVKHLRKTERIPALNERRSAEARTGASTATKTRSPPSPNRRSPLDLPNTRPHNTENPTVVLPRNRTSDLSGSNSGVWRRPVAGSTASVRFSKGANASGGFPPATESNGNRQPHSRPGVKPTGSPVYVEEVGGPCPQSGTRPSSAQSSSQMRCLRASDKISLNEAQTGDEVLKMVVSPNPKRIAGQLKRLDGSWVQVMAIVEPQQAFNSIADSLVSELDLLGEVDQYTGEGCDTWIESSSGRIRPTGRLRTLWGPPQLKPISLELWVFPYHRERRLVLGEHFVRNAPHYKSLYERL